MPAEDGAEGFPNKWLSAFFGPFFFGGRFFWIHCGGLPSHAGRRRTQRLPKQIAFNFFLGRVGLKSYLSGRLLVCMWAGPGQTGADIGPLFLKKRPPRGPRPEIAIIGGFPHPEVLRPGP